MSEAADVSPRGLAERVASVLRARGSECRGTVETTQQVAVGEILGTLAAEIPGSLVQREKTIEIEEPTDSTGRRYDRPDFLFVAGGVTVAVECKIKGGRDAVAKQVIAYASSPQVDAVVLVTSRSQHRLGRSELLGKPFATVWTSCEF